MPKLQEKVWERGKISDVMEEGEKNCISVMRLPKFLLPQATPGAMLGGVLEREYELWQPSYWKWEKKQILCNQKNCGNGIAKIEGGNKLW